MFENFYYEEEFESCMEEYFKKKYSLIKDSLYKYLTIKFIVLTHRSSVKYLDMNAFNIFLAKEMNIDTEHIFYYKDTVFYVNSAIYQSISNIMDNETFFKNIDIKNVDRDISDIRKYAINKSRNKPDNYKEYVYSYYALKKLNELYGVTPIYTYFENIRPVLSGMRTTEEICEAYIQDMSFDTYDHKTIYEKDIEEYLYIHLYKLMGYTPIQRQYTISKDCIADIYAREDRTPVIIELKNTADDRLLWQITKYQKEMSSAKVIVISTEWNESVLEEVKKLNNVDAYKIGTHISSGKIDNLTLNKL